MAAGEGLAEMATPVAPRVKDAPAAGSGPGPGIADLQMELRLWWKDKTRAERAALLPGLEGAIDAAWDAGPASAQEAFLQQHIGEFLAARGPVGGQKMNGVAGNVALRSSVDIARPGEIGQVRAGEHY
jgi:hypothetical protein